MPEPIIMDTLAAIRGVHSLWVFCPECRRNHKLDLVDVAARVGWQIRLTALRARLTCRDCGAHGIEMRLVYDPAAGHGGTFRNF